MIKYKNFKRNIFIIFMLISICAFLFIYFDLKSRTLYGFKLKQDAETEIDKAIKVCNFPYPPSREYFNTRCDLRDRNRLEVKSYPADLKMVNPTICTKVKFPFLYGYGYPNLQEFILPENNSRGIGLFSKNYIESVVCASNAGDQIASLQLLLWSQYKLDNKGNICLPTFYEYIHNRKEYFVCTKNNNYSNILPTAEIVFKNIGYSKKYKSIQKLANSELFKNYYGNLKQLDLVWNENFIPELWLFRYIYLLNNNSINNEELNTIKKIFEIGFGMKFEKIQSLPQTDFLKKENLKSKNDSL